MDDSSIAPVPSSPRSTISGAVSDPIGVALGRGRDPLTPLRRACLAVSVGLTVGTFIAGLSRPAPVPSVFGEQRSFGLTTALFDQDAPWLLTVAAILLMFSLTRRVRWPATLLDLGRSQRLSAAAIPLGVTLVAAAGSHWLLHGFALSRDEIMADFDATIFAAGRLVAPIPAEWRAYARALNPDFVMSGLGDRAWLSAYLPGNAALRAIVGLAGDPTWTSPLLTGLSAFLVHHIGRRLWPARPDAALVAAVLLGTSSQVLITAMTPYAMSAHLTLNLLWLALVLRDDRLGHGAAMAVGFVACGLHQVVFHPLFVAPFLIWFWRSGRKTTAFAYGIAYLVIGLIWVSWHRFILNTVGIRPFDAQGAGPATFFQIGAALLIDFTPEGVGLMLKNLLRFVVWQHILLLPLAIVGWHSKNGDRSIAAPLAAGVLMTIAAMFLLLPYQGHGWGYRYLHGLIGSLCLLGGYGWLRLSGTALSRGLVTLFLAASAASLLVLLPAHAWQIEAFQRPYRQAVDLIRGASSDVVVVDPSGLLFAADLVRNDPFLRNRPLVLDLTHLRTAEIENLCRTHSVSILDARQVVPLGFPRNRDLPPADEARRGEARSLMMRLGCGGDLVPAAKSLP